MIKAKAQIDSSTISYNPQGTISWVNMASPSNVSESTAVSFLRDLLANGNTDVDFVLYSNETTQHNFAHKKFNQTYKGVNVYMGQYFTHGRNGLVELINGNFFDVNVANVTPANSESQALTYALNSVNAVSYMWQNANSEAALKQKQNNPNATYYPSAKLVIIPKATSGLLEDVLAYKFEIICEQPLDDITVIVNAQTGGIVKKYSNVCNGNVSSTALTSYSGNQTIISNYYSITNDYKLEVLFDNSNFKKLTTVNGSPSNVFTNTSSNWSSWATTNPNDRVALDAHWGITQTLEYFENKHQRLSIDPARSKVGINCIVHDGNVNSSKFIPYNLDIMLSDGDVVLKPLTSIDICAHETGHGIAIYSAQINPDASLETFAISESLSDIWGACVKNYVNNKLV